MIGGSRSLQTEWTRVKRPKLRIVIVRNEVANYSLCILKLNEINIDNLLFTDSTLVASLRKDTTLYSAPAETKNCKHATYTRISLKYDDSIVI